MLGNICFVQTSFPTSRPLDWFADSASWDRSCNAACEQHWRSLIQPCAADRETWTASQHSLCHIADEEEDRHGYPSLLTCSWAELPGLTQVFPNGWHCCVVFFPCNFLGPLWTNLQLLISCHGLLHFLSVNVFKWSHEVMFLAHSSCWFWLRCCWEG